MTPTERLEYHIGMIRTEENAAMLEQVKNYIVEHFDLTSEGILADGNKSLLLELAQAIREDVAAGHHHVAYLNLYHVNNINHNWDEFQGQHIDDNYADVIGALVGAVSDAYNCHVIE